jgi:NTE family protein
MRIHLVRSDPLVKLGYSSKLNAEWEFFLMLRGLGRTAAEDFLAAHAEDIGRRPSVDLDLLLHDI